MTGKNADGGRDFIWTGSPNQSVEMFLSLLMLDPVVFKPSCERTNQQNMYLNVRVQNCFVSKYRIRLYPMMEEKNFRELLATQGG